MYFKSIFITQTYNQGLWVTLQISKMSKNPISRLDVLFLYFFSQVFVDEFLSIICYNN